jgi:hypothetical protein
MPELVGRSITSRIAVGPHRGRKVFNLQTLPINAGKKGGVSLFDWQREGGIGRT